MQHLLNNVSYSSCAFSQRETSGRALQGLQRLKKGNNINIFKSSCVTWSLKKPSNNSDAGFK